MTLNHLAIQVARHVASTLLRVEPFFIEALDRWFFRIFLLEPGFPTPPGTDWIRRVKECLGDSDPIYLTRDQAVHAGLDYVQGVDREVDAESRRLTLHRREENGATGHDVTPSTPSNQPSPPASLADLTQNQAFDRLMADILETLPSTSSPSDVINQLKAAADRALAAYLASH